MSYSAALAIDSSHQRARSACPSPNQQRTKEDLAFDPFNSPWLAPHRADLIRRYLEHDDDAGVALVAMTFLAPADVQWSFILELVEAAPASDETLSRIAAGPVEGLLGRHGPAVIARVETLAEHDAKFRRILTGVWKHTMSDEIWERVCAARAGRN